MKAKRAVLRRSAHPRLLPPQPQHRLLRPHRPRHQRNRRRGNHRVAEITGLRRRLDSTSLHWQHSDIMDQVLSGHLAEIAALCGRHGVVRLEVFGSAATGDFDPARSDIDLIATFSATREPGYADRYLDFADALERLFGRKVDLITPGSIRNPVFAETIRQQAGTVYESEKHQAA